MSVRDTGALPFFLAIAGICAAVGAFLAAAVFFLIAIFSGIGSGAEGPEDDP